MKKIYLLLTAVIVVLASCDEKKDYSSYPPKWEGFRFERNGVKIAPTSLRAGDQITVTAVQKEKGKNIDATNYAWTLALPVYEKDGETVAQEDSIVTYYFHTNYDGTDNGNPRWTFTVPANAVCTSYLTRTAKIKFVAKYNFYGNGISIENGPYNGGLSGSITPQSGSMSGGAIGNVTLGIHNSNCGH